MFQYLAEYKCISLDQFKGMSISNASRLVVEQANGCRFLYDCINFRCGEGRHAQCIDNQCSCRSTRKPAPIIVNQECESEADCKQHSCPIGLAGCLSGRCVCLPRQEDSPQIIHEETFMEHDSAGRCRNDNDCKATCPPGCRSANCMNGTCFYSC
ncbi:uncharacterized protein LOC112534051 isoform X2 [Ricinus communis]|uniref:uncharacterized protein LOC112534051 isoform X2 n=1 Tax=Ricinus communis TaxID=3988 RepID=UPI00201AE58E|nr:uncharacterized protein LOC112534051 isoform X2 [Ricinus communis]